MKAKEIEVGGVYSAKISNRIVPVRVDSKHGSRFAVTNLRTKRTTVFKTAGRFRRRLHQCSLYEWWHYPSGGCK